MENQMHIQLQLGSRIRELRRNRGWSQEAFADFCGIHRSHMGEIERGRANVTLLTLLIISKQLQVTASALLNEIA
jgi:transcriptional regulator with XRE-family HTH domain